MNSLATNMHISQELRGKYQFGLAALPMGLMFGSFAILWIFSVWLSAYLGIPEGAPVKDQPNGTLWVVVLLTVMVLLMIAGYLLGWVLNYLIVRTFYRWNVDKANRVFLYSEVPDNWLKEKKKNGENALSDKATDTWAKTRIKGKWNFILTKGIFGWGMFMYVIMGILPAVNGSTDSDVQYFIWQALLWGSAGALFGGVIWYFSESQYVKKLNGKSPNK